MGKLQLEVEAKTQALCVVRRSVEMMSVTHRVNTQILDIALERLRYDLRQEPDWLIPWAQIADSLARAHEELLRQGHVGHELDLEQLIIAASFMTHGSKEPSPEKKELFHRANQVLLFWINHARYRSPEGL